MGKTNGKSRMEDGGSKIEEISITLPVADAGERAGFQSDLVDAGELSLDASPVHLNINVGREGAAAFVRVRNGLRARNAKLRDGRPVFSNADALRFVVDAIAAAVDSPA